MPLGPDRLNAEPRHATGYKFPGLRHPAPGDRRVIDTVMLLASSAEPSSAPPVAAVLPFVVLLLAIAVLPLVHASAHWWEHNSSKLTVALCLAAITLTYYALADGGHKVTHILEEAMVHEYVPFIVLLFALYTICGGIRVSGNIAPTPGVNTLFLAIGAGIGSFVGTTGASMLLIRPLLDINTPRKRVVHTVVFFIFLVSNIGGTLLPIGDPPLFMGYLFGVPFLWTLRLWKVWLFCVGVLLIVYYVWERRAYALDRADGNISDEDLGGGQLVFRGLHNLIFLGLVVFTVGTLDHNKDFLGTGWVPPMLLRECVVLAITACAWISTHHEVRSANRFNFGAIIEVACLFAGIFITMKPALELLAHNKDQLAFDQTWQYFWTSGALSSVLDNAPTYVVFFETAKMTGAVPEGAVVVHGGSIMPKFLAAISMGSVFMGANTYIGNGPNFMVKSIAEAHRVPMPSFFGYMVYSGLILIPLFVLVTLIFAL